MPQIKTVKAQKPYTCDKCGKAIDKGQSHLTYQIRTSCRTRGTVHRRHTTCRPRASELTQSQYLGAVYSTEESFSDLLARRETTLEFCADLLIEVESAKDTIQEQSEECQGRFDNMPDSLQQGSTGQQLESRVTACEDLVSELEDLMGTLQAIDDHSEAADIEAAITEAEGVSWDFGE